MRGPIGAFKAPVQMRMSLSWTDGPIDGQTDKITKAANKDRQKQTRKSKRAIKKGGRLLVSETMTFPPMESDA